MKKMTTVKNLAWERSQQKPVNENKGFIEKDGFLNVSPNKPKAESKTDERGAAEAEAEKRHRGKGKNGQRGKARPKKSEDHQKRREPEAKEKMLKTMSKHVPRSDDSRQEEKKEKEQI